MGSACSGGQSTSADGPPDNPPPRPPPKEQQVESNGDGGHQSQPEPVKNGMPTAPPPPDVHSEHSSPHPDEEAHHRTDDDADTELKNIDGGPAQYKLVYFAGLRFRAEPIRLILRYADVPYEEQLVSFPDWPNIKGGTPMGGLPLLHVGNRVLCQANAIGRYLAKKYGLYGKTLLEGAKVDMYVDAMTDLLNELGALVSENDPGRKSDLWHQLKDDVVCPFLDRCIKMLAENNTGWFVGDEATWADLAISELLANITEKVDSTLLDTYPALRAHINGVRALPHIPEYIAERPDAMF